MRDLAFVPFCESQMSIYMTTMSEFLEARMTHGRDARVMSWNMEVLDKTSSICELLTGLTGTLIPAGTGLK